MKTAMILAAGRGERLRPYTYYYPKALCVVRGRPLIEHHLINLASARFERVIINHAYLGGAIKRLVGDGARFGLEVIYSPEPPGGLETGGGIVNALHLLGTEPFVTINADIFTDMNFASLTLPNSALVHLMLGAPTQFNHGDFGLKDQWVDDGGRDYTFLGVACYHPDVFKNYQIGRYSITPTLRKLAQVGNISGEIFSGLWIDIGTPARLQFAANYSNEQQSRL